MGKTEKGESPVIDHEEVLEVIIKEGKKMFPDFDWPQIEHDFAYSEVRIYKNGVDTGEKKKASDYKIEK